MCDRISLINNGKIVLEGDPEILKKNYWDHSKIQITSNKPDSFKSLKQAEIKGNYIEIKTSDVKKTFLEIMNLVKDKDIDLIDIKTMRPKLEEIFMEGVKK